MVHVNNSIALTMPSTEAYLNLKSKCTDYCMGQWHVLMLQNELRTGQVHCDSNINKHLLEALRYGVRDGLERVT